MINKTEIKPTGTRLLVERVIPQPEVTESGLILTANKIHKDYSAKGREGAGTTLLEEKSLEEDDNLFKMKILEVGPAVMAFNKGEVVITNKYAGLDIYNDRTTFLINETDIIATTN